VRRSLAITTAAVSLVSAVVVPPGVSAAAPRGSLTVTALGRDGQPVDTQAEAISLRTNATYYVRSGRSRSLPADTYVVLVDIENTRDGTSTVGAKRVTVSGDQQVTFRARFGKPVRAWLRPTAPAHYAQSLDFTACVNGTSAVLGVADRGRLFVLPAAIPEVAFAFSAEWLPTAADGVGPRFAGAAVHHGGIPDGAARTFRQADLVPVRVVARRGPQSGSARIELGGTVPSNCSVRNLHTYVTLPQAFTAYLQPGRWSATEDAQDFEAGPTRTYRLGHHYRLTMNRAVWGPSGSLPYSYFGRVLTLNTSDMFTDPTLSTYGAYANVTYRLTHAGQTVLRTRVLGNQQRRVAAHLPERGWYTLTEYARRPPDRLFPHPLSPRADLRLHFRDGFERRREIRGYITRFVARGLDIRNSARGGSHTTVQLQLLRDSSNPDYRLPADRVSAISVWWSGNRGRIWHRLPITRRQGHWAMVVPNPASGAVSLRASVIDVHGNSTRTTVIDGYAVDRSGSTRG
jgi:hypothetical protein